MSIPSQIDIRTEENDRELQRQKPQDITVNDYDSQIQQLQNDNRLKDKLASNIGNAINDFGADKSSINQTFSDNLKDTYINVGASDFPSTKWDDMNCKLGAPIAMKRVLFNVDDFAFQFTNKLMDIDVAISELVDSILPQGIKQNIIGINDLSANRYGTPHPLLLWSYDLIFFSILYEILIILVTVGDRHNNPWNNYVNRMYIKQNRHCYRNRQWVMGIQR